MAMDPVPTSPKYPVKYPEKVKRETETEERHRTLFFAFLIAVFMGLVAGLTGYMIGRAYFPDALANDTVRDVRRPVTSPVVLTDDVQQHVDFVLASVVTPEPGELGYAMDDVITEGVVVTNDGLVMAPGEYTVGKDVRVLMGDGSLTTGTIEAYDPYTDVSFISINTKTAVPMTGAEISSLEPGDRVFGVKRIPGLGLVWESGFVSLEGESTQERSADQATPDLYTTLTGEHVVVVSREGGFVGFATDGAVVSHTHLESAINAYVQTMEVHRYGAGFEYISLATATGLSDDVTHGLSYGAYVTQTENTALQQGDVIVEVNGTRISADHTPEQVFTSASLDSEAEFVVVRQNRETTITIELTE